MKIVLVKAPRTIFTLYQMKLFLFNIQCDVVFGYSSVDGLTQTKTKTMYKSINTSHFQFTKEPVILPIQTHQVFYIDNPKNSANWKVFQIVQNKHIWHVPELDDVKDQQLNVLEIIVEHCVDDHIDDDKLCKLDIDPTIVERPIVCHVVDDFINDDN